MLAEQRACKLTDDLLSLVSLYELTVNILGGVLEKDRRGVPNESVCVLRIREEDIV